MNHLRARQVDPASDRPDAGRFRYTTFNRRTGAYPIGYCSPLAACSNPRCLLGKTWDPDAPTDPVRRCSDCDGRGYLNRADPCPGHDTAEEARAHYRAYLLAETLRLDVRCADDIQHQCDVDGCATWTQAGASVGQYQSWWLCDAHRTAETVDGLFGDVGESWES